jgi:GntR family transcriptional regulator, histidine utilization repressor
VNPYVTPNYLSQDFKKLTPSHYLFQIGPLTKAEHVVEAILPDEQIQELLKIKAW